MLAGGFFDAHDGTVFVEGEQAGADVDGRYFLDFTVVADGELAGAAADVDVQNYATHFRRVGYRARTMGSHGRFKAVAGADRDELTGFLGEQLADGAGVAPTHGNAGEDQCAGVDLFAANFRDLILVVDELAQCFDIDSRVIDVGRQEDLRFIYNLALGHPVARPFEGQFEARENQMGGRRSNVDADAGEPQVFFILHVAVGIGKRTSRCGGHGNPYGFKLVRRRESRVWR